MKTSIRQKTPKKTAEFSVEEVNAWAKATQKLRV
jgi:hypothetical protein